MEDACSAGELEVEDKDKLRGKRRKKNKEEGKRKNNNRKEKRKVKKEIEKREWKGIMDISSSYPPYTVSNICFAKHFSKMVSDSSENLLHQHNHSQRRAKHTLKKAFLGV